MYSTSTNNRLCTSSNTRNQAVIEVGRVDIQSKNSIDEYDQNIQRNLRTELTSRKTNVQCYNCNEKGHYVRECPKPRFRDAKYSREQMLLATKDEVGVHLDEEEDDFMLNNSDAKPTYDAEFISEFWQTASTSTLEDGEVEITATIDGQLKTITEASLRRHLKLEDADGISSLPNYEIFVQLALMGMLVQGPIQQGKGSTVPVESHHIPITTPSTSQPPLSSPSRGRRIAEIDQNPSISLVQDEGTSWIQEDAKIQGRTSADTEILLDQEEPTELVGDLGSGEKGEREISTANISVSTASVTPKVSSAVENLVYIRRSAEKRKDKGKAIMKEDEYVQKKTKKQLEQERLGHKEAIRLQEQINEEERQRIARDAKIAKQLQEEFDRAKQEQEVVAEADQAHDIDWSDPVIRRYHAVQNISFSKAKVRKNMCIYLKNQGGYKHSHFKGMKYEDIRPIFERVWDQNQSFVPMDSELEVQRLKRAGQDVVEEPAKRQRTGEASGSVQEQACKEPKAEELSQEQLHHMIIIILVEEVYVEAL
ncbi:putative ribonuclease H-like domain-containing protein [Tanacetum coccineum]